jgi:hypothetical protein
MMTNLGRIAETEERAEDSGIQKVEEGERRKEMLDETQRQEGRL